VVGGYGKGYVIEKKPVEYYQIVCLSTVFYAFYSSIKYYSNIK
jgi:hypothetical protein